MDTNKLYLVFLKTTHDEDQAREALLHTLLMDFDL